MMTAVAAKTDKRQSVCGFEPTSNSGCWTMKDGTRVDIRPICTDDEARMMQFHKGLSERSVYMRYFESLSFTMRTAHARLARICFADPEREIVLVAVSAAPQTSQQKILAVGRLSRLFDPGRAETALLVLDDFQGLGLGTELLRRLIQWAREQNITRVEGEMLRDNTAMQRVLRRLGFRLRLLDPRTVRAVLEL